MNTEILHQNEYFYSQKRPFALLHRRWIMTGFMLAGDALTIAGAALLSIAIWAGVRTDLQVDHHVPLVPYAVMFFCLLYSLSALYPAIGIGPVEELKRLTLSTIAGGLALLALSFFLRNTMAFSRAVLLISWAGILMGVPLIRKVLRRIALKLGLWGIPVLMVGRKDSVAYFQKHLSRHPLSGYWPVLCISGGVKEVFSTQSENQKLFANIETVLITDPPWKADALRYLQSQTNFRFRHVILLLQGPNTSPFWFTPVSLVEHMGIEVLHNLLNPAQRVAKRILEFVLILLSLPVLGVLFVLVPLLIKASSPGPVFFRHRRIGFDGREIGIWKFRTMVENADALLQEHLRSHPELQSEWEQNFKFKEDPRVTRIGKFLRRTSLDELPQIWNVLQGEMSLIGPRPIVKEEVHLYGEDFRVYKQVRPGITGLWQVSGRNDLSYPERVTLDVYYVQNWSIWLDIHILLHTILAALQARGAY